MAQRGPASSVRIKALHQRQEVESRDVLHPGNGLPWEDRGSVGSFKAFVETSKLMLLKPRRLWAEIHRTDATTDSMPFALAATAVGFFAGAINAAALGLYNGTLTAPGGVANVVILAVVSAAIVYVAYLLGSTLFLRMLGDANRRRIPVAIVRIVFGYALAPVWLALLPFAGPVIAVIWILVLWFFAARKRLFVRRGEASVAFAVMTTVLVLALAGGGIAAWWVLSQVASNFTTA